MELKSIKTHLSSSTRSAQFQVRFRDDFVTAFISEAAWSARFGALGGDSSFTDLMHANQEVLDSAVARRVAAGGRQPVVLRVGDL